MNHLPYHFYQINKKLKIPFSSRRTKTEQNLLLRMFKSHHNIYTVIIYMIIFNYSSQLHQMGPSYDKYLTAFSPTWVFWHSSDLFLQLPIKSKKQTTGLSTTFSCEYRQSYGENLHFASVLWMHGYRLRSWE